MGRKTKKPSSPVKKKKALKFPHKVRLTPDTSYEVVWVDKLEKMGSAELLGECRYEHKQIALVKDEAQILETFIHELLHAVDFEYGIGIPHKTIYQLEEALARVLRLNKWIKK